ncbi:hypothetical protein P2H44_24630 [Albimonas sp. CAU 1670]|uniref:hypothetical protein n=1 Tax=Albimonas sp. CAU 1670 TaxID=3032599 RepID=UPI0023DBBCCD|nr:hypothetical protein [Albimonas sp. CAU 1670]MDF2235752.1 hypothetical protein [Albimonas sp. CAU 1670]
MTWAARTWIAAATALASVGVAGAQETAEDGWRFQVSPYLWAAGLSGTSGTLAPLPPAEVDLSFGDIFDDLRFAGMLAGQARKGRFGLAGDIQYVETRADGALPPFHAKTRLTSKTFLATAVAEYAVLDREGATLSAGGGLRLWSVGTDLKLSGGPARPRELRGDDVWVDPVVSLRGALDLSERWFLHGWLGLGGFGLGSDLMVDAFAAVGWRVTEATSVSAGWRWMKVDRDASGFLYDVEQQGPLVGLTVSF